MLLHSLWYCHSLIYCCEFNHSKKKKKSQYWESNQCSFDVLLTVHLSIFISVINQLDAQNFCFTISLFHASTCFEHHVLIIRMSKLHYTASGIITPIGGHLMQKLREDSQPVHKMATFTYFLILPRIAVLYYVNIPIASTAKRFKYKNIQSLEPD